MTLKAIILKNLKFNMGKYKAYFLCSSFTVCILFLYASLYYNPSIIAYTSSTPLYQFMKVILIGMSLFSFVFISYANSAFVRSRNSEFGLFMTLGMGKKDIDKMIRIENFTICFLALSLGLVMATIFSKLFFMVGVNILQVDGLKFALNYKSFLLTLGLFIGINVFMLVLRKRYVKKLSLSELIKQGKESGEKRAKPVWGFIGLSMMGGSFIILQLRLYSHLHSNIWVYLSMVFCLYGLYLIIAHFGGFLSLRQTLHKNILSHTMIRFKFRDYSKILYIVALLGTGTILMVCLVYSIFTSVASMTETYYPYHIQYTAMAGQDNLSLETLEEIQGKYTKDIRSLSEFSCLQMPLYSDFGSGMELWSKDTTVMSISSFNERFDTSYSLEEDQVYALRNKKETVSWLDDDSQIKLADHPYTVKTELYYILSNDKFTDLVDTKFVILVPDLLYDQYSKDYRPSTIYTYTLDKNTMAFYQDLIEEIQGKPYNHHYIEDKYNKDLPLSSSLVEQKAGLSEFGFEFFIMIFIACVLFISSGVVLYFKLQTDRQDDLHRYKTLQRIGITKDEVKSSIYKEMVPLFMVPALLGSMLAMAYVAILLVNTAMYQALLVDTLKIIGLYMSLQFVFCMLTCKRYKKSVISHM